MSDMQRLMDNLLLRLPGAVESVVRLEIFNALNEFCRETNCWWHRQTIQLQPQQTVVPIFAPMNAETVRILRVTHDGIPLNAALRALDDHARRATAGDRSTSPRRSRRPTTRSTTTRHGFRLKSGSGTTTRSWTVRWRE